MKFSLKRVKTKYSFGCLSEVIKQYSQFSDNILHTKHLVPLRSRLQAGNNLGALYHML